MYLTYTSHLEFRILKLCTYVAPSNVKMPLYVKRYLDAKKYQR